MLNALLDAWAARLEPLMSQFAQLPGAMVERGPAHPTAPDKRRQQKVESLICEYPFLAKDQGYTAFLYSGAYAVSCDDDVSVQIFGPIELTLRDLFQTQTVAKLAATIEQRILAHMEPMGIEEAGQLVAS